MRASAGAVHKAAQARTAVALDMLAAPLHQQTASEEQNCKLRVKHDEITTASGPTARMVRKQNLRHASPAKPQVAPEVAARVVGTLEVQFSTLHQPCHLEADARVDQIVEVARRVLQGESIRVDELLADHDVDLGRQVHQV